MGGLNSWLCVLGMCVLGTVKERLLALTEIKSLDAQSIANELQQQLQMRGSRPKVRCTDQ